MTKKELIKTIAVMHKTSVTQTQDFYNSFENALIKAITSNEEVVLSPSIGKFILKSRKARVGRNPQTGKKLKIPTKTVVNFKLSKTIKDEVKNLKLK
ncbi:DNA-binding protein HU [Candidatus Phytoplasma luffae]|uniref:DNA-binding protein HU n=1 Tax=Loofah witches'-broom phytoplasma TaxID=35773 RepID=A0A975FJK7_LOWBP|nr:HU family DNA-binding protein [Candidatus Phytoplasma luffae]QTX02597.1 DNA-binding protein HU [Candidatus Phytoplasma luffae]QTX02625.1 DNA-binding protein HU [Candidatus Phytoplasma luffae]QTX02730.1 DNA-binding protein HU [Candidatus Phytoplasma luffae]QTX02863.1 DNA-binding protein HU [Candidatus Phytoplasma luffae]QTX02912.1 DNA-binding protein HU [Candidatus Phytoplasma luffae]